jgi:hypothetical protein
MKLRERGRAIFGLVRPFMLGTKLWNILYSSHNPRGVWIVIRFENLLDVTQIDL